VSKVLRSLACSSILGATLLVPPTAIVYNRLVNYGPMAQATTTPQTLMIKANDLAELPSGLGSWHIVGCGVTALIGWTIPGVSGKPATGPCAVGQDRIFASYTSFQRAVINGTEVAGNTIIFDPESWIYTPTVEKDNLVKYEVLAGQLARANGIGIIYTPQDTNRAELDAEYRACAKYATAIELQTQYQQYRATAFKKAVQEDLAAIRAVNTSVPVLVGYATDPGGKPALVSRMVASYKSVVGLIQGFQLNLARWRAPIGRGCAPSGCPDIGVTFLQSIGIVGKLR